MHAGMIARRLGKAKDAIRFLEQALATNPHVHVLQADVARAILKELQSSSRTAQRERDHDG